MMTNNHNIFRWNWRAVSLAVLVALACAGWTASGTAQEDTFTTRWELARLDDQVLAVLWVEPAPGHHFYANDPGELGKPTQLTLTQAPEGASLAILYPAGESKPDMYVPSAMVNVYESETPIFIVLGPVRGEVAIAGTLEMLLCSDTYCLPKEAELNQVWPDVDPAQLPDAREQPWWPDHALLVELGLAEAAQGGGTAVEPGPETGPEVAPEAAPALPVDDLAPRYYAPGMEVRSLGKAVLFALIAGLILNFMPCVLPVISLKLSSLVEATKLEVGGGRRRLFRSHNLAFSLGILTFFLGLSIVLLSLGAAGMAWGRLFQEPALVMGMTVLVFVLGLSLFGVFDLPVVDFKAGRGKKQSLASAFSTGVLATLLATPCSGPFLGGVLVWALRQPPLTLALVFVCIGLGMASPYLIMALFTDLVRVFPKPGAWTVYLQRLVGFFLMATTIYLLSILPLGSIFPALLLLLAAAFAAWMWGGWVTLSHSRARRYTVRLAALAVFALAALLLHQGPHEQARWEPYDAESFAAALGSENMLVDFTADWCPTCKLLEQTALSGDNLDRWGEEYNLRFVQADMTRDNPEAEALLEALGSSSIPVVAIFPAGDANLEPLVLRDLFTTGQLEDALKRELE